MLILRDTPKGIDQPIQRLQKLLYDRLSAKWGLNGDQYWQAYGRAYKNQAQVGYLPEVYVGGNEYREVYYDDNFAVISFFTISDRRTFEVGMETSVAWIVSLDLTRVKPVRADRVDEEVHADVLGELRVPRFGFTLTGLQTGIDNVYREYELYRQSSGQVSNTDSIKYRDMHPLHVFRVDMNLIYQNSNC